MKAKITKRLVAELVTQVRPYEVRDMDLTGFGIRIQPSGRMTYFYDYRLPDGRRNRYRIGPVGSVTPVQARDAAERTAAKVLQGVDPQEEKKRARVARQQQAVKTLRGFLKERYEPWVRAHRKTGEATLARIRKNFEDLLDRPVVELDPWLLEKWRSKRLKAGTRPSTVNRDVIALKAALSKAVEWGLVEAHPLAKVKPVRVDTRGKVRFLSAEEEQRLRAALLARDERLRTERANANRWRRGRGYESYPDLSEVRFPDHLHPLVLLAMNSGLRRGELFGLTWGNVALMGRMLTVEGQTAKSGSTRHVPLNDEAVGVLRDWRPEVPEGLVFPGQDGRPLTDIKTAWGNVLRTAQISNFRFHDLRHHFASRLVMAGVDLNTVRELLGHSDLHMTLRYAHLAPEHKAEAVQRLNGPGTTGGGMEGANYG